MDTSDPAGREHKVELTLPAEYPASPPAVKADLPIAWTPTWSGTATSLLAVYEQFIEVGRRLGRDRARRERAGERRGGKGARAATEAMWLLCASLQPTLRSLN